MLIKYKLVGGANSCSKESNTNMETPYRHKRTVAAQLFKPPETAAVQETNSYEVNYTT